MATLVVTVSKVDDTDPGADVAVTAVESTTALAGGFYRITAVIANLRWKLGAVAVTVSTGAHLAIGNSVLIRVPLGGATLRLLKADATPDGSCNIVVENLFEVPGVDARLYLV